MGAARAGGQASNVSARGCLLGRPGNRASTGPFRNGAFRRAATYDGAALSKEAIPSALLLVAIGAAAIAACSSDAVPGSAPGRGVYIPEHWQTTRTVTGHQAHVVREAIACSKCHELTETEIGKVDPARCADCHAAQAEIEHAKQQAEERYGQGATADCTSCHAFTVAGSDGAHAGAAKAHAPSDCGRCHFSQQGDTPAVQVHHTRDCLSCHQPHEDETPTSAPCDECHAEVPLTHAAQGRQLAEACSICHEHQHAPAKEARDSCQECHALENPLVPASALFTDGHTECVGCHRPHEFARDRAVECQACHESMNVLGGPRVRAHNTCTSCHDPHDVKSASAKACSSCHQDISPNHPKHGKVGTCTGCHDPHPASTRALSKVRDCTSCHQAAAHDTDFHEGVSCRKCHEPHDFVLNAKDTQLCAECHQDNTARASKQPGHQVCGDCHRGLPHRPQALQAGCDTCHQAEHAKARAGHATCTNCHEPHAGSLLKNCASCHAAEHKTAPSGHRECTQCHEPHSGSSASKACSSCHSEQASTPHGKLSATCGDCHRPHGPSGIAKPPSCASCHQQQTLKGLHGVSRHQSCNDCHAPHAEGARNQRQSCLSCHKAQLDHFPNAPTCISCHLFVEPARK